jgi:hypothetical protein
MKFLIKSIASTVFGMAGGWLGDFVGFATGLFLGFAFSVVGWYWAKNKLEKYDS